MEITITIKIDGREVVNFKEELDKKTKTGESVSRYARFFDDSCVGWDKDPEYTLMYLMTQQQYANDKLKTQGYLFLNDVYGMLGIPRTKAGQIVGWVYDEENPIGDNRVDFGIYSGSEHNRKFVNGCESSILLDFNVDGNIFDKVL